MAKKSSQQDSDWNMTPQEEIEWYERSKKHWRSWGSWFSWGSPIGLGLFFISLAITVWILAQVF